MFVIQCVQSLYLTMLKKLQIIISGLIIFFISSCSYDENFKTVQEKNLFTIEVAPYLTKTRDLSTIPSLQYYNRFRTVYLVVKSDLISTLDQSFEDYHHDFVQSFEERFPDTKFTTISKTDLNGFPAIIEETTIKTDGEKVWYLSATVKGKQHYFQLLSWTLDHRKEKYEVDIQKMIQSFQVL